MGSNSIVRWTLVPLVALAGVAVFAKVATVSTSDNEELAGLYQAAQKSKGLAASSSNLYERTNQICLRDELLTTSDLYRAASILARSNSTRDALQAHDLGLAIAMGGFKPGLRIMLAAQERLLEDFHFQRIPEPNVSNDSSGSREDVGRFQHPPTPAKIIEAGI